MIKSIYQLIKEKKIISTIFVILIFSNINYSLNQLGYIKTLLKFQFNIDGNGSSFDLISTVSGVGSATGPLALATFIIPSYLFILLKIKSNNTIIYYFRFTNKKEIWSVKVFTVILLSLIYSFIVVILTYIIGSIYLGSFKFNWNDNNSVFNLTLLKMKENNEIVSTIKFNEIKVLIMIFVLFLIGLIIIGLIVEILNNIFNNKIIVFLIVYGMTIIESVFDLKSYLLMNKIHFKLQYLINDGSYFKTMIYLFSLLLFLYIGGNFIESEKEYV